VKDGGPSRLTDSTLVLPTTTFMGCGDAAAKGSEPSWLTDSVLVLVTVENLRVPVGDRGCEGSSAMEREGTEGDGGRRRAARRGEEDGETARGEETKTAVEKKKKKKMASRSPCF